MENPDHNPNITDAWLREAQQRTMERLIQGIEELTDRIGRLEIQNQARERIPVPAQSTDQYEEELTDRIGRLVVAWCEGEVVEEGVVIYHNEFLMTIELILT